MNRYNFRWIDFGGKSDEHQFASNHLLLPIRESLGPPQCATTAAGSLLVVQVRWFAVPGAKDCSEYRQAAGAIASKADFV